ncbi:MAG TPA: diacylglycerol kinase family protein [Frankiaceae bacterium]|nr:diacylglycerol kinase family protein [Frankiaceae bacterium]
MRAVLVFNPKATATNARVRDVLKRALESDLKLDVVETKRRGHAIDAARQAAADGVELVVVLGGDGTVNEVVNGIAGSPTELAVVPGGSTNVFARALGLSASPVDATSEILDALRSGSRRRVNLGVVNGRYFTFCAGVGIDAEVVRVVERHRRNGRKATPALYVRSAVSHYYLGTERQQPSITIERPGAEPEEGLFNVIVANGSPWTYFGTRAVNPCPEADFDGGLDVLAMRKLKTVSTLRVVRQMFATQNHLKSRAAFQLHDVDEFTIRSDRPLAYQLDGDYLGEIEELAFRSLPDALSVVV